MASRRSTSGRQALCLSISAWASIACSANGISQPEPPTEPLFPTLIEFGFEDSDPQPGFALQLNGRVVAGTDISFRHFIPVTVMNPAGDVEEAHLTVHRICELEDGTRFRCNQVLASLHSTSAPTELTAVLRETDAAHLKLIFFETFTAASIRVFSGDVLDARDTYTRHPAFISADVSKVGSTGVTPPQTDVPFPVVAFIRTAPPSDNTPPDALVVEGGAVVTARYTQPDGSILEASITIQ